MVLRIRYARLTLLPCIAAAALALPVGVARAEDPFAAAIRESGLAERVAFHAVRIHDGATLAAHRADAAMHPASNMKVLTAFAALRVLGPAHRFRTRAYGEPDARGTAKTLTLVGDGDPALTGSDLSELARRVRDRGVTCVERLAVDSSVFDEAALPPGFDAQPAEHAPFRAAVAGLAVDRARITVTVLPGPESGAPARITTDAPGYAVVDNQVITGGGRAPSIVLLPEEARGELRLVVRGTIALGSPAALLATRSPDPLRHAAMRFREALLRAGVVVEGQVVLERGSRAGLLAEHVSPPLAAILAALGKESDNFSAEMMLKQLGRQGDAPGSSALGAAALADALRAGGLALPSTLRIDNGSGLFGGSRVTAALLTTALARGATSPVFGPEFVAHLAVAGRDGTLARRLAAAPPGRVRAKTGTLRDVTALSGLVLDDAGRPAVAFSFLANGVEGRTAPAKALADTLVTLLLAP